MDFTLYPNYGAVLKYKPMLRVMYHCLQMLREHLSASEVPVCTLRQLCQQMKDVHQFRVVKDEKCLWA